MNKPSILIYALGGCKDYQLKLIDMYEKLKELHDHADLVWNPYLMDSKFDNIPDVDIAFIEGNAVDEDQVAILKQIRDKAKFVITLGGCGSYEKIPELKTPFTAAESLETVYIKTETTDEGRIPYKSIPKVLETSKSPKDIIKVDYNLRGHCHTPKEMLKAIKDIVSGERPDIPAKELCQHCHAEEVKE